VYLFYISGTAKAITDDIIPTVHYTWNKYCTVTNADTEPT